MSSIFARAQLATRYMVDLVKHCALELRHDRAPEMAASLTYRTIFSLIPVFILALLVFNAFGGFEKVGGEVRGKAMEFLGLTSLQTVTPTTTPGEDFPDMTPSAPSDIPPDTQPADTVQALEQRQKIDDIITTITNQAQESLNFKSVGVVGIVLLFWTALSLLVTVEDAFNRIYDCPKGRSWHLRITIYWAILTLGPVLVVASLYLTGVVMTFTRAIPHIGPLLGELSRFAALLASWLLLFLLYSLMPNTRVQKRAALIGSFLTAVLYELGKYGFQLYVAKAVPYSKLYGSLGLIPLFLFWVYLTWLIVLFGLELTHALQAMKGRQFKHLERTGQRMNALDPRWIFPIMTRLAQAFAQGKNLGNHELADEMHLPAAAVAELTSRLESAGLIHRVQQAGQTAGYTLSVPAEQIELRRLNQLARHLTMGPIGEQSPQPGWRYLRQNIDAGNTAAANATLASLLQTESAPR